MRLEERAVAEGGHGAQTGDGVVAALALARLATKYAPHDTAPNENNELVMPPFGVEGSAHRPVGRRPAPGSLVGAVRVATKDESRRIAASTQARDTASPSCTYHQNGRDHTDQARSTTRILAGSWKRTAYC